MSAIADLVTFLLSAGLPPDSVSTAVDLAIKHGNEQVDVHLTSTRHPPDIAAEKRREWDRNYRREKRMSTRQQKPAPIEDKKEERKKVSSRASQLQVDWKPDPEPWHRAINKVGEQQALAELENFRNHAADKGRVSKDWNAAFRNWIAKSQTYNGHHHAKTTDNPRAGSIIGAIDRAIEALESEPDPALPEDNLFRLPFGPIQRS